MGHPQNIFVDKLLNLKNTLLKIIIFLYVACNAVVENILNILAEGHSDCLPLDVYV